MTDKPTRVAYRLNEAAAACGFSRDTLLRQIYAGRLRAKRLSTNGPGAYVITAAALDDWLQSLDDIA